MSLHERYYIVNQAESEFSVFFLSLIKKHNLTFGEIFQILSIAISSWSKYLDRDERHPDDSDKKGDET